MSKITITKNELAKANSHLQCLNHALECEVEELRASLRALRMAYAPTQHTVAYGLKPTMDSAHSNSTQG